MFTISFLILVTLAIVSLRFTFKFSLERHIIPEYPAKYASLRQIVDFYREELAKQGMHVEIRILDENNCNEPRVVRGISGNGYLFLFRMSDVFQTRFKCGVRRAITIYGVGSKAEKDRAKQRA